MNNWVAVQQAEAVLQQAAPSTFWFLKGPVTLRAAACRPGSSADLVLPT